MRTISWIAALVIALLGAAAPALAHHSLQSEYDIEKSITLKGPFPSRMDENMGLSRRK